MPHLQDPVLPSPHLCRELGRFSLFFSLSFRIKMVTTGTRTVLPAVWIHPVASNYALCIVVWWTSGSSWLPGCQGTFRGRVFNYPVRSESLSLLAGRLFGKKDTSVASSPFSLLPAESGSSRLGPNSLLTWTDTVQEKKPRRQQRSTTGAALLVGRKSNLPCRLMSDPD